MSFGDDTLEPPTLICQGSKFIVARWMFDDNIEAMRDDHFPDEDLVTGADIAVLRSYDELSALAEKIKDDIKEFYDEMEADEPLLVPYVWSWHIPDEPSGQPAKMILFRGDTEMCTVHIEHISPIEPIRKEHA